MLDNDCHDHDIVQIKRQENNQHSAGIGIPGTFGLILFFGACYLISQIWSAIENWHLYEAPAKYALFFYHFLVYEPLSFGKTINDFFIVNTLTPFKNLNFVIKWAFVIAYYFGLFQIYLQYLALLEKYGLKKYRFLIPLTPAFLYVVYCAIEWLFR